MSDNANLVVKGIISNSRITLGLVPGLGLLIVLRMAIHLYRPDIEDSENRIIDVSVENLYKCYDFIIVGGGSAGSVVANRLTENPEWNVLLIEAGQDENVMSEVPVLFPALQLSSIDWQFVTQPNDGYCLGMKDGKCKWPRGKALGGSSVINAMLYIRGNKRDYDHWERIGNIGWAYKDVFKYFLKSEDMRIPGYENDPYHSTGGYLTVEHFAYQQPITNKILEAAQQLGYPILDVNGDYQTGFTRSHATLRDGLRCSTAKAFLRSASKRPNLHVSVDSLVEKILIDKHKTAYGVKFVKNGQEHIVRASKEVILSAGAIQSPQMLMLSGIGDAEYFKELGIYPIAHLPGVGKNLQDHVAMGGHSFLFDNPNKNGSDYCFNYNTVISLPTLMDFVFKKKGLLYSMMEAEAMAFVNTKYQDPAEDYPDIQLFIAPTADNMDGGIYGKRANGLTDETYAQLYEEILYQSSFSIVPLLLRPKSRGYIKLKDTNPQSAPLIYPNYFADPDDIKTLIEGARIVQELVNQPALKDLNARPNPRRNPGCADHELMSAEHLECQARHHTLTIYHPVGTCAMGPADDPNAVVDARLRVYQVNNLRVVDGSIMPNIVSGNTNAPIIMIAEKASDMIKEDWSDLQPERETTCPPEYNKHSKTTEEEKQNKPKPDLFSETTNLFTYFAEETPIVPTDSIQESNPKDTNKISLLNKELDTQKNGISPENDVLGYGNLNPNHIDISPNSDNNYNSYPTNQPYPYWYPSITQGQLIPAEEYYKNLYYPSNPYAQYKPKKYNAKKTKYPNHNLYPGLNSNNNKPLYYETDESVNPKGQKTCKVWLYYDGVKYEVVV